MTEIPVPRCFVFCNSYEQFEVFAFKITETYGTNSTREVYCASADWWRASVEDLKPDYDYFVFLPLWQTGWDQEEIKDALLEVNACNQKRRSGIDPIRRYFNGSGVVTDTETYKRAFFSIRGRGDFRPKMELPKMGDPIIGEM